MSKAKNLTDVWRETGKKAKLFIFVQHRDDLVNKTPLRQKQTTEQNILPRIHSNQNRRRQIKLLSYHG